LFIPAVGINAWRQRMRTEAIGAEHGDQDGTLKSTETNTHVEKDETHGNLLHYSLAFLKIKDYKVTYNKVTMFSV
jgi:hypothetical protein